MNPTSSNFFISSLIFNNRSGLNRLSFWHLGLISSLVGNLWTTIEGSIHGMSSYDQAKISKCSVNNVINSLLSFLDNVSPIYRFLGFFVVLKLIILIGPSVSLLLCSNLCQFSYILVWSVTSPSTTNPVGLEVISLFSLIIGTRYLRPLSQSLDLNR